MHRLENILNAFIDCGIDIKLKEISIHGCDMEISEFTEILDNISFGVDIEVTENFIKP